MIKLNTDGILKVQPLCPVFNECGGCQLQDISYADELRVKENHVRGIFQEKLNVSPEVFKPILASPQEYHYRNRLDIKLFKNKNKEIFIGFSAKASKWTIVVDACPIARQEISDYIPEVKKQAIAKLPADYRIASLVVRSGDERKVYWGGIGRRSLVLPESDYLWTEVLGKRIFYSLETFFQANLFILPGLMQRIRSLDIWGTNTVFYDLYGGVGLFGVSVCDLAGKVILIEQVPASLKLARYNVAYHQFKNFFIHDGRVEDVLPSILKEMPDARNVVMVDPPRAGLSNETIGMLNNLPATQYLLYLSCNPETLVANCQDLKGSWSIKEIHPLDFFPRTDHLETLVLFERCS